MPSSAVLHLQSRRARVRPRHLPHTTPPCGLPNRSLLPSPCSPRARRPFSSSAAAPILRRAAFVPFICPNPHTRAGLPHRSLLPSPLYSRVPVASSSQRRRPTLGRAARRPVHLPQPTPPVPSATKVACRPRCVPSRRPFPLSVRTQSRRGPFVLQRHRTTPPVAGCHHSRLPSPLSPRGRRSISSPAAGHRIRAVAFAPSICHNHTAGGGVHTCRSSVRVVSPWPSTSLHPGAPPTFARSVPAVHLPHTTPPAPVCHNSSLCVPVKSRALDQSQARCRTEFAPARSRRPSATPHRRAVCHNVRSCPPRDPRGAARVNRSRRKLYPLDAVSVSARQACHGHARAVR